MNKNGKYILVIEDENSIRTPLVLNLEKEGFSVGSAQNGREGLAAIKEKKPDLVLLDIIMPVMGGIVMLKKLRAEPGYENLPVIMLTNLNDADEVNQALTNGVKDYIVKSDWKLEDLLKKIKQKLDLV